MDSVTIIILIGMALLLGSAVLIANSIKKREVQTANLAIKGSFAVKFSCILSALVYVVLVYIHVLPIPDADQNLYRLSLGGAVAIVGLIYLALGFYYLRKPELHGLSVLMFAGTAVCCIGLLYTESSFTLSRSGWALYFHLFLSLCSYAILSIAAVLTVIEPWQSRQLRKNPVSASRFIPSLESLDTETFKLIGIGFSLLTVALLSGFFFLENMYGQHLPHKVVLSLLSWLVFAILLLGRWRLGWRGKTAMRFALMGFFLLLLGYFGSKWVLEVMLERSWS